MVLKSISEGSKLRVLVVGDLVLVRRPLAQALSVDAHIQAVGRAANRAIALLKIPQLNPETVTLDIEMPDLGGLESLRLTRSRYPQICVDMCSRMTEQGASAVKEALSLGAQDCVTKCRKRPQSGIEHDLLAGELASEASAVLSIRERSSGQFGGVVQASDVNELCEAPSGGGGFSGRTNEAGQDRSPVFERRSAPGFARTAQVPGVHAPTGAAFGHTHANRTVREATEGIPVLPGHMLVARRERFTCP